MAQTPVTFLTEREIEEYLNDDNGDIKSYTDCELYKEHTQSYGISKEDADYNTDGIYSRNITVKSFTKGFYSIGIKVYQDNEEVYNYGFGLDKENSRIHLM